LALYVLIFPLLVAAVYLQLNVLGCVSIGCPASAEAAGQD